MLCEPLPVLLLLLIDVLFPVLLLLEFEYPVELLGSMTSDGGGPGSLGAELQPVSAVIQKTTARINDDIFLIKFSP